MGGKIAIAALALLAAGSVGHSAAPLYDPVALNIGISCQWQQRCMAQQRHAMKDARSYMLKTGLPLWRVHLCNRNAARSPVRVDWVGFNNCIRNASLQPPPPPPPPAKRRPAKRKRPSPMHKRH